MILRLSLLFLGLLGPVSLLGQETAPVTIPAGTPFPVKLTENVPLRVGEAVKAELLYPVYANNVKVLPAGTQVTGTVVSLVPNKAMRIRSRLNGDFTPFSTSVVHFADLVLADGSRVPLTTGTASDGAPIYKVISKPRARGGLIGQEIQIGIQTVRDTFDYITGPGKADRAKQLLYSQIPYHPQRIAKGTSWTFETDAPLEVAPQPEIAAKVDGKAAAKPKQAKVQPTAAGTTEPKSWMIQAYLKDPLDSANAKVGEKIHAVVAEPIYNADHTIAVPQGATITGSVTRAKAAKKFGRSGNLQFDFRELQLPEGQQAVQTTLAGIDSNSGEALAMNSEGKVEQKPKDKIMIPLLLGALASRPFDQEGGALHQAGKNGVASNSLGVVGFIVGISAQAPNLAAGIGAYGAALSIYDRWIKKGKDITFGRDTRIVLQTTPRSTSTLKAANR